MKRNIVIYAFWGILIFCCLATPANAQTLKASNVIFSELRIGDVDFPYEILSITLPSAQKPCKITYNYSHPVTGEPTVGTVVTTHPIYLIYFPIIQGSK